MINSGSTNTIFIFDSNKMFSFMVVYNLCLDPNLTLYTYNNVDQYVENKSILPDIIVISNKLINKQSLELLESFKQKSPHLSVTEEQTRYKKDMDTRGNSKLKNDFTQAIFLLSQLKVQLGQAKEALQAAEAAAYFAPNDPSVVFQVGILRSANGDTVGAIQALARAVDLNPQYANARFFLGVMYAISGDLPKAITAIEAVAALSPENATAVAADLAALRAGKNPFPQSRLGALGIPQKVSEPTAATKPAPSRF